MSYIKQTLPEPEEMDYLEECRMRELEYEYEYEIYQMENALAEESDRQANDRLFVVNGEIIEDTSI